MLPDWGITESCDILYTLFGFSTSLEVAFPTYFPLFCDNLPPLYDSVTSCKVVYPGLPFILSILLRATGFISWLVLTLFTMPFPSISKDTRGGH